MVAKTMGREFSQDINVPSILLTERPSYNGLANGLFLGSTPRYPPQAPLALSQPGLKMRAFQDGITLSPMTVVITARIWPRDRRTAEDTGTVKL